MPELPEVETIARTLAPQIVGSTIASTTILRPESLVAGASLLPLLTGSRIRQTARRGKLLILPLDSCQMNNSAPVPGLPQAHLYLVFHLKMTGSFFVHPPGSEAHKHTRIIFDLAKTGSTTTGRLFFNDIRTFGYCRIMLPQDFPQWLFFTSLGLEPLIADNKDIAGILGCCKSDIKTALLDQRRLAGIGNIYADESLFRAKISPLAKAAALPRKTLLRLAASLKDILNLAIQQCGSSIRNYRDAAGNVGAFQNNFMVYGRKGKNCKCCGVHLDCLRVAGRTTICCPNCQREF